MPDDAAVAAGHSVGPARWRVRFDELMFLVAGRFARAEPRRTAGTSWPDCCRRRSGGPHEMTLPYQSADQIASDPPVDGPQADRLVSRIAGSRSARRGWLG